MESLRKAYLLEQYRHSVLHTEIPNTTASAMPARALDTTPQFAERRSDVSSVVVSTTPTTMSALAARLQESTAPILFSNAPTARDHTKPIPPPVTPSRVNYPYRRLTYV